MTGKARPITGPVDVVNELSKMTRDNAGTTRGYLSQTSAVTPNFNAQNQTAEIGTIRSKLNRSGDIMTGAISFTAMCAEISGGVLTISGAGTYENTNGDTLEGGVYSNRYYVYGQGLADDDLVTINEPQHKDFQLLFLSTRNGTGVITIKNSGNIVTNGGGDLVMNNNIVYCFGWDALLLKWKQLAGVTENQSIVTWSGVHAFTGTSTTISSATIVLGDANTDNLFIFAKMNTDLVFEASKTIDFTLSSSTATGGAISPPSNVTGYLTAKLNGVTIKIPYYAN